MLVAYNIREMKSNMKIKFNDNVAPEAYDMKGQPGWASEVQWRKGEIHDLPEEIADPIVYMGDAEYCSNQSFELPDLMLPTREQMEKIMRKL